MDKAFGGGRREAARDVVDELWGRIEDRLGERLSFGRDGARAEGARGSAERERDLRRAVLDVLTERGMTGYEVIRAIEERSAGAWVPTAGAVYPLLQALADEGLVAGEKVEGRTGYSLTEAGQEAAAATAREADESGGAGRQDSGQADREQWGRGQRGAGPWGLGPWGPGRWASGRCADAGALPRAGFDLAQAAAQIGRTGTAEQVQEAVDELVAVRKRLYAILARE